MPFIEEQLVANGGAGSPETLGRIVWTKAVFDVITSYNVTAMVVNAAGGGYSVGDTFELDYPGSPGVAIYRARGEVVSISPGVVRVISCGAYTVEGSPINAIPTSTLTGGGSGLTIDATFQAPQWSNADGSPETFTAFTDNRTDFEWMCVSTRSPNPVYVGMKTWVATASQVGLKTMTGFNDAATFENQPGASPGDYSAPATNGGYRLNAAESDPKLYMQFNERRLIVIISDAPRWQLGYMGLFTPFSDDPASNYPLPLFVAGTCTSGALVDINSNFDDAIKSDIRAGHSSVCNPFGDADNTTGDTVPYGRRDNLSSSYLHYDNNGGSSQAEIDGFIWPAEFDTTRYTDAPQVDSKSTDPDTYGTFLVGDVSSGWFHNVGTGDDTPGIAPVGPGGRSHFLAPITLIQDLANQVNVIGELEGLYKIHGRGLTEGDRVEAEDGTRWLVFPDIGGSAPLNHWCAVEIGTG